MPLEKQKFQKIALTSGLIGLVMPLVGIVFSYYPGFIWLQNDLSDFGLYSPIFNWCLILSGLLMAFFFLNLPDEFTSSISSASRIFFLLACASLSLIGFFPKNTPFHLHYYIACGLFFLFPLALICLIKDFRRRDSSISDFTLIILLAFLIVWLSHYLLEKLYGYQGLALPEFSSLALALIWIYGLILKYLKP